MMPIYNKALALAECKKSEVDDNYIETAKVKRARQQAYFNSYKFDAIEVLPCQKDADDADADNIPERDFYKLLKEKSNQSTENNARNSARIKNCHALPPKSHSHSNFHHHLAAEPPTKDCSHASANYKPRNNLKPAFLQRCGTSLKDPSSPKIEVLACPESSSMHSSERSCDAKAAALFEQATIIDAQCKCDGGGENFILPRAMLKYQSGGSTTNSMPLTTVSAAHSGADKLLTNQRKSNFVTTSTASTLLSANITRFGCKKNTASDEASGFQISPKNIVAIAIPTVTSACNKNSSKGSKLTTTAPSSVATVDYEFLPQIACDDGRNTSTTKALATANSSNESDQNRRAISHYSTDKSGSSGYYSSNVCSTYSLEDHIYCEPVIDIVSLNSKSKSVINENISEMATVHKREEQLQPQPETMLSTILDGDIMKNDVHKSSQSRDKNGVGKNCEPREKCAGAVGVEKRLNDKKVAAQISLSENFRILETSIVNLDRHLKNFANKTSPERVGSFMQSSHDVHLRNADLCDKLRTYNHLPTIEEGYAPSNNPYSWQKDILDDSLLDLDLDSFLLVNECDASKKNNLRKPTILAGGLNNPIFVTDEQEENNYKCAKYINSCPENAYRLESEVSHFRTRYEDQLHFQNTRELLEDVREKIRLLSEPANSQQEPTSHDYTTAKFNSKMPKQLECMITALKQELESYLNRMNQHSEQEIRQLCTGLLKNQKIVKMKNAFERRRSTTNLTGFDSDYDFSTYETIQDSVIESASYMPTNTHQKITSIRCLSDPNFKMKRKSLAGVFPVTEYNIESIDEINLAPPNTHLQRNLSFKKSILNQLDTKSDRSRKPDDLDNVIDGLDVSVDLGDKDSILDWHRKRPSIWEMYYGSKRLNQSLLGKYSNTIVNCNPGSMSYPSSRPESDFTLDLPRAEQLRNKMEKEKKFRQRCRYITTFLSLVFFLLTVMVVSLVLTRGKRMFGSMI